MGHDSQSRHEKAGFGDCLEQQVQQLCPGGVQWWGTIGTALWDSFVVGGKGRVIELLLVINVIS